MQFTRENIADDSLGKIDYSRSGSHEENDTLKEIWKFTTPGGNVSIVVAQEGVQTHYFSSDPKIEERGRMTNGCPMFNFPDK